VALKHSAWAFAGLETIASSAKLAAEIFLISKP
jgi:hypothetical protein